MSKKFTKKLQKSISTMVMITTVVWMSGIAMIAPIKVEAAAYDKATLTDITSTSQKIAPDGESNLAVIKLEMTASEIGTEYKTLRYMDIDFTEVSGTFAAGEADKLTGTDLANISNDVNSGVLLYQDSGSTAGSFDSEDGRLTIDVSNGTTDITNADSSGYVAINQARLVFGANLDGVGGPTISTIDSSPSVFYVVLRTSSGGSNDEAFTATVSDVRYYNSDGSSAYTASVAPTSFDTRNITLGSDGVAPTISKVETYDNNTNGIVDRVKVYFSESMASGVTSTDNFVDALGSVTPSEINTTSGNEITLGNDGVWSTTTNVNDTFTIDFANETYGSNANSTGDTWTVIYDQSASANTLKDATGTELLDKSITTTDMARPYLMTDNNTTKHDLDGDSQIDEIRVKFSETLGSASDATGFTLRNTTSSIDYTLGAVNGFVTSSTSANTNDTIKISITESGSKDLNNSYTLSYAEQTSGGIVDAAGNKAVSRSAFAPALAANPTITKIEVKDDTPVNGKIDEIEVTFSCTVAGNVTGDAYEDFAVSGYAVTAGAASGFIYTLTITPSSVYDTEKTPVVSYTNDGDSDGDYIDCGDANFPLETVSATTPDDKAPPVLLTATLYESDNDDIWDSGETVQLFFSEQVEQTSIATSWSGDTFGDFTDDLGVGATNRPDSGTMEIQGKVVILTASENATTVLSGNIGATSNEVKDSAGNSVPTTQVAFTVTPTTAPTVDMNNTLDENDNGIVDALAINFNGIVDGSTITASDFAVARGSNFTIDSTTEGASSTGTITPDLTISEVVTQSGGNDSVIIVRFAEVGEDTSAHPQVKYVKGTLADLAGNKVDTFNAYSADNTKFETTITKDTRDKVAPKVMEIRLKDRNANNKYDQLMVTYSEAVKADDGDAANNGPLSSTGWAVADHTIAASGNVYDNTNMALTYATTNAVFKADINEISGTETAVPEVTFSGSGVTKDAWDNLLAAIAAGDVTEISEITDLTPPSELSDGDVARVGTAAEVFIIKIVGSNKYKRHIVSPEVFNSYGHLSWSAIKSVSSLDDYSLSAWVRDCTGPNETPAATDKVYEVNADSTMHWLNMTAAQFYARGGSDEAIYNVNSGELGLYTLGVDVMYE